jgi:hypothetical protein
MADTSSLIETAVRVLARVAEAIMRIARMRNQEAAMRALERLEKHAAQVDADAIAQDEVQRIVQLHERDDG